MEPKYSYSFATEKALESLISSCSPGNHGKFLLKDFKIKLHHSCYYYFHVWLPRIVCLGHSPACKFSKAMKSIEQVTISMPWQAYNQWVVFKNIHQGKGILGHALQEFGGCHRFCMNSHHFRRSNIELLMA